MIYYANDIANFHLRDFVIMLVVVMLIMQVLVEQVLIFVVMHVSHQSICCKRNVQQGDKSIRLTINSIMQESLRMLLLVQMVLISLMIMIFIHHLQHSPSRGGIHSESIAPLQTQATISFET